LELREATRYVVFVISLAFFSAFFALTRSSWALLGLAATVLLGALWVFAYPFLKRRIGTISVDIDLVFALLHLYTVSTAKPARHVLFKAISEGRLYKWYSDLAKKIYALGREWGYSFAEACRYVAKSVENKVVKELLGRLSAVLSMGGDLEQFFRTEYSTLMSEYETIYNRVVEAANVFYGVHTSMLASGVFMIANFMILIFFFGGGLSTLYTSFLIVGVTMLSVTVLLYVLVPKDLYENNLKPAPSVYRLADAVVVAGAAVFAAALVASLRDGYFSFVDAASSMAALGTSLTLAGLVAKRVDSLIEDVDLFFPVFVRSYGMHLKVVPNMAKALEPLLITELGRLKKPIANLYSRLVNGIDPRVAWRNFSAEVRSELANRTTAILIDTVENGGDPAKTGAELSDHYNSLVRLRRRKLQVGKTFETTTYMMHGAASLIIIFIILLMQKFALLLSTVQKMMPTEVGIFLFTPGAEQASTWVASTFLFSLALMNAVAIKKAVPSNKRAIYYYFGVLLLVTSVAIIGGYYLLNYLLGGAIQELFNLLSTVTA